MRETSGVPYNVHKSLELLEEYHAELFRPTDYELRFSIEKVIGLFKTNLFNALCDIQEFYDAILLNKNLSPTQKVIEARRFAERWEKGPIGPIVPIDNNPINNSLARSRQVLSSAQQFPTINKRTATVPNSFFDTSSVNRLVDEYGREWEVEEVLIDASQVGLGFSISGGRDREPEPDHYIRITDISPGGAVASNGRLRIGDVILRVNDVDCLNVEHQVAVSALQKAGSVVRLLVKRLKVQRSQSQPRLHEIFPQRPSDRERQRAFSGGAIDSSRSRVAQTVPQQTFSQPSMVSPRESRPLSRISAHSNFMSQTLPNSVNSAKAPRLVTLLKGDTGLGFNIVGGEDNEPIYVSHVMPGGPADLGRNVRKGDVLLRVNDLSLYNASHAQAAFALKSIPPNSYVLLLLQYRPKEYHEFEDKVLRLQNDLRNQQQKMQNYGFK